ncbi:hypothetical protein DBR47_08445 [Paucibacter sp. KBW04]|nr:hypothetical protein DBR47_08445 [Paucibacter sp. KBW04]
MVRNVSISISLAFDFPMSGVNSVGKSEFELMRSSSGNLVWTEMVVERGLGLGDQLAAGREFESRFVLIADIVCAVLVRRANSCFELRREVW